MNAMRTRAGLPATPGVRAWPWLLTALVFLMLVTYIPAISLWLPSFLKF